MPRPSSISRVRLQYTNPSNRRLLLFETTIEVDSALVQEHGISWTAVLTTITGQPGRGSISWHHGDRQILQDELDLFYVKLALENLK